VTFTLVCVPPTANHQRKKIVRVGKWTRLADKPELVAAKDMLDSLLLPFQPAAPIAGPVCLRLEFTWPWLKGHGKRIRCAGRIPHTSKPDLTNVAKTFEDRLAALRFIEDDKAVVDLSLAKWWGDEPGVRVSIAPYVAVALMSGIVRTSSPSLALEA
jgi:Holliday junction resolvase RusA-like endonuclease